MKRLAILWGALLCASPALAQLDWAVISTTGDPDPVTAFDLANPGGSNTPLGHVDGNFNRGMDFDSPNSFYYYVSTNSLNDPGDRGLWYWNNNVNAQLFNTPFDDSGDGDATLNADFSTFYISTDDGDGTPGDSIYAFENLNGAVTFTEVGETGLGQLIGIAVDPVSGLLYGYDSSTEALYTISTEDASPTLVGFSGESIAAIGGMDFSADGATLLLADDNDGLFTVDPATGLMTPAGDANLNISALSFRVPEPATVGLLAFVAALAMRRRCR